ncbi:MAG: hypothetical protein F4W93_12430 [Dehalococcoidia bacterium]|nr:hypothetical protein [Dehalococcoidia bacterium]
MSVHTVITSPPYYGLRMYQGNAPLVWGGSDDCVQQWAHEEFKRRSSDSHPGPLKWAWNSDRATPIEHAACVDCGAWYGVLGNEPPIQQYVENVVQILREVKRVLRDDGTLWPNLGVSYTSSGKGLNAHGKYAGGGNKQATNRGSIDGVQRTSVDLPSKNLKMIPARVAIALQDDGWILRRDTIWCLSGGTQLYAKTQMQEGPTPLKDLARLHPSTVQLWNGERWTQVTAWRRSDSDEPRVELVLRSGERIGCTASHKWPTGRGLLATSDIRVGDVLQSAILPEPADRWRPQYLTDALLWLIGLFLAEGSRSEDTIQLSLGRHELDWLKKIKAAAEDVGNSMTHTLSEGKLDVRLYGRVLNAVLYEYISGKTAKNKHFSPRIWRLPNDALRIVIQGYLYGNGHDDGGNRRNRLGFTRNYALERDLRVMAARLGATLTLNLAMVKMDGRKFPSFRGEWRWSRSGHHNEKDRAEIIEVRRSRGRTFYDVSVADEPHLFSLASGVLTHNSKENPMPESVRDWPTAAPRVHLLVQQVQRFPVLDAPRREGHVPEARTRLPLDRPHRGLGVRA